ncbi:MAG: secretin N-terminal domain-containing protein [Prosthecobacter sp.]
MKAFFHLAAAALLGLHATQVSAQTPTPPATVTRPATPPNIPRPVLPPGLQRPGITNPNAVPPAVPGAVNRPGLPAGAIPGATGPKPVSANQQPPSGAPAVPPTSTPSSVKPNAPSAKPGEKVPNYIAFDAETVDVVLEEYYRITKRRVLKDRGLEATTVTIMVPGEFTDEEYQDIIEKGLLMHGLALVPSGTSLWQLVAAETGSSPGQQQLPMVLDADKLPETDQVVVHVATLNYLSAEDAANTLQSAIPPHPYGKIVAVPNARSLVITEASQTIRAYLDLIKQLDLPPSQTVQKTIKLIRTDPEDVAKQLESLLDLKNGGGSTGSSASRPATPAANAVPRAPAIPGAPPTAAQPAAGAAPVVSASGGGATAEGAKPVLLPLPRTSSLLVIARPVDIELIEKLVAEIDAEATANRFVSRRLNYIDLTTFLGLAEKALMRYDKTAAGSTSTTTGQNSSTNNNSSNSGFNNFGNSGFGNSGFGNNSFGGMGGLGGGMGGGFGGGGLGGSSASPKIDVTVKANSVLIGNTLVIIDPGSSKYFASGPPEQLQTLQDLADELDVRPRQIFIAAVIGEFTLGDDFRFGLDWVSTLKNLGGGRSAGGILNTNGTIFNNTDLNNLTSAVASGLPDLGGLTAYGQISQNLHVFMRAVETSGKFRVLQKPVLTTMNHQPASIYIGQQIAIAGQTFNGGGGLGFTSTTQYIPVRLQLDITPHIFNDQEILLEFKQQNNSTGDITVVNNNEVPNITEQGMSNSLIVPDRTVAMLGGLISEQERNNKTGLPFLVRLPLIKHIFGNTAREKDRRELMIFVQPMILPDGASHINEQTRFMNNHPNTSSILDFAGYPEEPLPPVGPNFYAKDKPRVQEELNPAPAEEKRSLLDKFKSLFKKQPKE